MHDLRVLKHFLCASLALLLLGGCEYFNLPLDRFIETHAAVISVEFVTFDTATAGRFLPDSGTYVLEPPSPLTNVTVYINLKNDVNLAFDCALTGTVNGVDAPGRITPVETGERRLTVNIANPVNGERYDIRLAIHAETGRSFNISVPPILCSAVIYTVTFDNQGHGASPSPQTLPPGGLVSDPGALAETGWNFGGWYKEADCVNPWNFAGDTVSGNITLYARWTPGIKTYTVTFDTGIPGSVAPQTVIQGSTLSYPVVPTLYADHDVEGWYTDSGYGTPWNFETDTVNGDITLYAKLETYNQLDFPGAASITTYDVPGMHTWADAINLIKGSAGNYVINLTGDFSLPDAGDTDNPIITSSLESRVSIRGNHTITLTSNGSLLQITNGKTVILRGPTLRGKTGNYKPMVVSSTGGNFYLRSGEISGNSSSGSSSGVYVEGGTFTMYDGTISGNSSSGSGGGVYVTNYGTFTMYGGTISGNTAGNPGGGGVYVESYGVFTMSGGTIGPTNSAPSGGGVYFAGTGNFTMSGGIISNNQTATTGSGGGVFIHNSRTFTMTGGEISGNTSGGGGGVLVEGTFIMNGGTINNNTATGSGGGVYVDGGTFNKNGNSSIVNNSAVLDGSQVYVWVDSSTGDRYRYADAGPGDTIDVPTDNGNAQGAAPWL